MLEVSDEEQSLIARSREGDHEAFEALVRRYQKMIHALAYRMTGSMADAEDISQETFVATFEQLGNFRGESKFSSWLYRVAANRCLNWVDQQKRRKQAYANWHREAELYSGAETQVDRVSEEIQRALMKLPAKQRAAIVLTTFDGLSHAEAGMVLNCSEMTVSWRIFAARRKLKKLLTSLKTGGRK